jgi:hypothetical protein
MKKHYNKSHKLSWTGDKSALYKSVKVQMFFRSRELQKYFTVRVRVGENEERSDPNQVDQQQLSDYQKVRKGIEDDMTCK